MSFSIVQVEGGLNFNVNINLTSPTEDPSPPAHVSAPCDQVSALAFTASVHAWCYIVKSDTTSEDQERDAVIEAAKKAAMKAARDKADEWSRAFARNVFCDREDCGLLFLQVVPEIPVLDNSGHNFTHWYWTEWAWGDASCTVTVYYGCCDGSEAKYRGLVDRYLELKKTRDAETARSSEKRTAARELRAANNESLDPGPPPGSRDESR